MTQESLASEARSLLDNEAFVTALNGMRSSALETLARADATDTDTIRTHQAKVRVIDELRGDLEQFIRSGQSRKAPGIA